jgi:hypothetical protein
MLLKLLIEHMHKDNSGVIKDVSVTTKDPKCFDKCMQAYRKCLL